MKRFILILISMLVARTLICQETMTTPHSKVDFFRQNGNQTINVPANPGNLFMNPDDLGNPPDKNWISQFGGDGADVGQDVITDASGNLYVTGYFSEPVNFGTVTLTSVGYTDGFLAKYSSAGNLVWIRQLSCGPYEMVRGFGITLDLLANVYITGSFNGSLFQIGTYTMTKTGAEDAFIAKYDSSGMPVMASHYGYEGAIQQGNRIAVDEQGNCFVVIGGENSLQYGGTYFVKFGIDGFWQWTYYNGAYFTDIKYNNFNPDASMNHTNSEPALYLTGYITHNADFGNTTLTATYSRNSPFLARFPVTNMYSDFEWAV